MIGAGSVLTKTVSNNELWFGNPAKHVGYITNEGEILNMLLINKKKSKSYKWENSNLVEI